MMRWKLVLGLGLVWLRWLLGMETDHSWCEVHVGYHGLRKRLRVHQVRMGGRKLLELIVVRAFDRTGG